MNENSKSEGEFRYDQTYFPPEKDPLLHNIASVHASRPREGVYVMSDRQVLIFIPINLNHKCPTRSSQIDRDTS